MRMLRLSVVLGLLVALLPALPVQAQEAVYLIRHAERDWAEDGGLVEEGRQRANAWGEVLADAGLDVIITSNTRRTRQTAQPIADMLGVPIIAISRYDFDGLLGTLAAVYGDDRVLIVGHSSSIPQILARMGHRDRRSASVSKSDYNDLFVLHPVEDGTPDVTRLNVGPKVRTPAVPQRLQLSHRDLEFWVTVEIVKGDDGRYAATAYDGDEPLGSGVGDTKQEAVKAALETLGEPIASDLAGSVPGS